MHSDRVYRKALPDDVIREELKKGSGTQFDPDYLPAFLELLS
jgi:HD-GYP domain-containing protein (c-di-GMP phosphodiesterase class II)